MSYNRRDFLKNTALAGSGLMLASVPFISQAAGSKWEFGLQLYTLRDDLPKDPKGIIKKVASFGYKQMEGYEGGQGIYWGMKHTEFKKFIDDLGIKMVSSHCDWKKDLDQKAAEAAEVGLKYLLSPYVGKQQGLEGYKKMAAQFNEAGAICKKHGIRFAYHNHDYSFVQDDGFLPQDILISETDPELVDFEMDMYWVITAGVDAKAYLQKHKNRFRLCHVKDRAKDATPADHDRSVTLGTGSIDYPSLLKVARENGMKYYIVEQERYDNTTPLDCARDDAAYMAKIKF